MVCVNLGGMQLRVDFTAPALGAFLCMMLPVSEVTQMCFACLLHESAHFLAFCYYGCKPRMLQISAIGCNLCGDHLMVYPIKQQAVILLSGVTVNLLAAVIFMQAGFDGAAQWQLATAACNLMPYRSTDGGTLLYLLLEQLLKDADSHRVECIWRCWIICITAALACLMLHQMQTTVAMWAMLLFLFAAEWLRL